MNEHEETKEVTDNADDAQVKGRQANIYHIDMDHVAKVLISAVAVVPADVPEIVSAAAVVPTVTAAPVKVVAPSTKRRGGVVFRDPEEESSAKTLLTPSPRTREKHLEIVPDEDDDVYTEATQLARKVPVMDYQIIHVNNKPRYKIIKADGTHQLYASFITMLKNFDRDDLETLWSIVKESNNVSAAGPIVPTAGQNYSNITNPISVVGPSNTNTSPTHGKSSLQYASQMLEREDITYSDHENVGGDADFNNLETSITVSPIPTTRTNKDHPVA
uniref:Uncharacterized protein n=1 Tax=Tanacetum cinerariifolium TaxID=118510 RepID=A0A6L2MJ97_TANCI|nr:hypothetical protein [Tanacetum cinerariifolium]